MTDIAVKELLSIPELMSLPHLGLLHYLLSQSDGKHVAHCLDLDLVSTGETREKAAAKLDGLVKAHIELALATGQFANLATKAPQSFWNKFADGEPIKLQPAILHIQIPESVQIVPVADSELRILAHAAHAS
jgi:predicted RNase H-like HicB family nuclease